MSTERNIKHYNIFFVVRERPFVFYGAEGREGFSKKIIRTRFSNKKNSQSDQRKKKIARTILKSRLRKTEYVLSVIY